TIQATLTLQELKKIARDERVKNIGENLEHMLASLVIENPPVVMVGENEHTGYAVPYWDAGGYGGGCGNSGTGTGQGNTDARNCPTGSPVPPTIVAILDNGASTDAATLAQSTTALTEGTISGLISTNTHRKIRDYQL